MCSRQVYANLIADGTNLAEFAQRPRISDGRLTSNRYALKSGTTFLPSRDDIDTSNVNPEC